MKKLNKVFDNFEIKATDEDRVVEFVASKNIQDRDGEIVKVEGINIKNFKKNPVILWAHDRSGLPIGKAVKIVKADDEMKVKIQFADQETYPFADVVYRLVKGGFLNALSIGFIPNYEKITYPKEGKGKQPYRVFNEVELVEVSVVPVPANQEALATGKALEEGVITDEEYKEFTEKASEGTKTEYEGDFETAIGEQVKELTNKIVELEKRLEELQPKDGAYYDEILSEFSENFEAQSDQDEESTEELTDEDRNAFVDELLS